MKYLLLIMIFGVAACSAPAIIKPVLDSNKPLATVVVSRESGRRIGEGALYFGEGKHAYFVMTSAGRQTVTLPAGNHTFVLSTKGTASSSIKVDLAPDSTTCLRVYQNEANFIGKFLLPFLRNAVPEFSAEIIDCAMPKVTGAGNS